MSLPSILEYSFTLSTNHLHRIVPKVVEVQLIRYLDCGVLAPRVTTENSSASPDTFTSLVPYPSHRIEKIKTKTTTASFSNRRTNKRGLCRTYTALELKLKFQFKLKLKHSDYKDSQKAPKWIIEILHFIVKYGYCEPRHQNSDDPNPPISVQTRTILHSRMTSIFGQLLSMKMPFVSSLAWKTIKKIKTMTKSSKKDHKLILQADEQILDLISESYDIRHPQLSFRCIFIKEFNCR